MSFRRRSRPSESRAIALPTDTGHPATQRESACALGRAIPSWLPCMAGPGRGFGARCVEVRGGTRNNAADSTRSLRQPWPRPRRLVRQIAPCSCALPYRPCDALLCGLLVIRVAVSGARGGGRTRMALRPRDFKSLASTDFATRAYFAAPHSRGVAILSQIRQKAWG